MKAENVTSDASLDWYSWGDWSSCSTTCGQGVRWRRRACLKDPRTCPQSSRPNSLFYEKTQIQDCQFGACINRTQTERSSVSSGEVGVSIAISAAIIAMVFIVAKALHCLSSPQHQPCCGDREQTTADARSSESPSPAPPPTPAGRDNMAPPLYITITQEMITGHVTAGNTNSGERVTTDGAVQSVISRSHTDVQVGSTNTSELNFNTHSPDTDTNNSHHRGTVDMPDAPSGGQTGTVNSNERSPGRLGLGRTVSDNTCLDRTFSGIPRTDDGLSPSEHRELDETAHASTSQEASTSEETEQALAAESAMLKPPSYDSLFPLFKRNQTL